jgi:hypothetical protein
MEVETRLVLEARSGLEGSIEHLVEEDKLEKDMLSKKGEILTKELAELLELVRLKEAEIAENNARIHEVQERISAVVSRFHGSQSDIDLKLSSLKEDQSKVDLETEALLLKKNEIDKFITLTDQKDSELRDIIGACSSEAKACRQSVEIRRKLASSILKSREDRIGLLKMEEEILQVIQMQRQKNTDARSTLQVHQLFFYFIFSIFILFKYCDLCFVLDVSYSKYFILDFMFCRRYLQGEQAYSKKRKH